MRSRTTILVAVVATMLIGALSTRVASADTFARPASLTATATSSTTVTLRWTDKTTTETAFEIQRAPARSTAFKKVATASANATSYNDSGLAASTGYKYRVRALKPTAGASGFSNVASATTTGGTTPPTTVPPTTVPPTTVPPTTVPVPSGLKVTADSCTFALATWNPIFDPNNVARITQYNLYRNNTLAKRVSAPTATVIDSSLAALTTYSYAITAVDASNRESAKTAPVSVTTRACPPAGAWVKTVGAAGSETGNTIAIDATGNAIVGGTFRQTADFGDGPITASANGDMFVAKFAPTRALLWVKHWASPTFTNEMNRIATDATGNVFAAGSFFGTLNLGDGNKTSAGSRDAFVAKFSPAGALLWSKQFGSTKDDTATSVAVDHSGNPVFTGYFWGSAVDFGGPKLTAGGPTDYRFAGADTYVLHARSADGSTANAFATPCGGAFATGIALDAADNVVLSGYLQAPCRFAADGALFGAKNVAALVLKYSPTGGFFWARLFDGDSNFVDHANAVVVDTSGNVYVTGTFTGAVDFGDATRGHAGDWVAWGFVAKLAGGDGTTVWSKAYGPSDALKPGVTYGYGVTVGANGNVTVVGSFSGLVDFGGGPLDSRMSGSTYGFAAYVATYSAGGAHLASNRYGSGTNTQAYGVANGSGGAVVTGAFSGTVDFGFGPVTSAGFNDVFMLSTGR